MTRTVQLGIAALVIGVVAIIGLYWWFSGSVSYYPVQAGIALSDGIPVLRAEVTFESDAPKHHFVQAIGANGEPISPKNTVIQLFNGKNLDGLYTWLQDAKYEDPRKVFTVEDSVLHISGDGMGYICTKRRYKDYHLLVEYRWGERTWLRRKTRAKDSGVIVHCAEPDGSDNGIFMAGIEAQIIEGGTGDFIVVPGKRADGSDIPVLLTAETTKDRDGETVWKKGGRRVTLIAFERLNWFGRDPDWQDVLGYRGTQDIDSPGQTWTRLDVICDGGRIIYRVNGIQANEAFGAVPSSGKILIQSEAAEIYIRRFELQPLNR